jgi:hypothetical protein
VFVSEQSNEDRNVRSAMLRSPFAPIALALAALICSITGVLSDLLWQPYVEPTLGYSVLYPAGLFDLPAFHEHGA